MQTEEMSWWLPAAPSCPDSQRTKRVLAAQRKYSGSPSVQETNTPSLPPKSQAPVPCSGPPGTLHSEAKDVCVFVCVCVWKREREEGAILRKVGMIGRAVICWIQTAWEPYRCIFPYRSVSWGLEMAIVEEPGFMTVSLWHCSPPSLHIQGAPLKHFQFLWRAVCWCVLILLFLPPPWATHSQYWDQNAP